MIFSIVIILFIALIAYFHYVQGLFSATISAVCAVIAAIIAVSYHETVITALFKGAMANQAQAMVLVALFAFVYFILRMIVDKTIPGNVRYPLMVDKIGAGAVGVIAGLFAAGVLALAAGSLPFGPSVAQYSRYSVSDRAATVGGARGNVDSSTNDEIVDNNLDDARIALNPAKRNGLIIPVDDMIAGVVGQLSSGALSNDHPLLAVHPDWPTELFGQRAGVQIGTKHVLLNLPGLQMVSLDDVFKLDSVPQIDAEQHDIRDGSPDGFHDTVGKNPTLKPGADEMLLGVRIKFDANATDEDGKARVSPLSVRLVGWKDEGGAKVYSNFNPIGTLEDTAALYRNKPDDPLIVQGGKSVDFVFKLPREEVLTDASAKPKDLTIKPGVFVEVKRMAQMDLAGREVKGAPVYSKDLDQGVLRKPLETAKNLPKHGETASANSAQPGGEATATGPIQVSGMKVGNKLFSAVYPGQFSGDSNVSFAAGNGAMKNKMFQKLVVNASKTTKELAEGDFPVTDFYVPDGKKMVQVTGKVSGDPWGWNNLGAFDLVDAAGVKYKPNGAMVEISQLSIPKMITNYDADNAVPNVGQEDGKVNRVHLLFNVPDGTQIKELDYNGQPIYAKGVKVP